MQKYKALKIDRGRTHNGIRSQQDVQNILYDRTNLVGDPFGRDIDGSESTRLNKVATNDEAERFSFSHQVEVS